MAVWFSITCSSIPLRTEKRFSLETTVESVKNSLCLVSGSAVESMILQLKNNDGSLICSLTPNSAKLGDFPVADRLNLHIVNTDPSAASKLAQYNDFSSVEKQVMSDEDYAKRRGTFREFKEKFLIKRPTQEELDARAAEKARIVEESQQASKSISVGDRCEVGSGSEFPKRGKVVYVGAVKFAEGDWVGIELDEPYGKNDGSVKGHRYFSCTPKHGSFQMPQNVKVGDFPEIDEFDESSSDEEL